VCPASDSGSRTAYEEVCAELERSAQDAEDSIRHFNELAEKLPIPGNHIGLKRLKELESVLRVQLAVVRRFASSFKERQTSEPQRRALLDLIGEVSHGIRRAALRLQAQTLGLLDEVAERIRPLNAEQLDKTGK
jgi:hypothetical protein